MNMFAKRIQTKFGEKGTLGGMLTDVKISSVEFGSLSPKFYDVSVKMPSGEPHNPSLVSTSKGYDLTCKGPRNIGRDASWCGAYWRSQCRSRIQENPRKTRCHAGAYARPSRPPYSLFSFHKVSLPLAPSHLLGAIYAF